MERTKESLESLKKAQQEAINALLEELVELLEKEEPEEEEESEELEVYSFDKAMEHLLKGGIIYRFGSEDHFYFDEMTYFNKPFLVKQTSEGNRSSYAFTNEDLLAKDWCLE